MASIGQFAKFRVVIDANFVIGDLIQQVRFPERGMTALEELVRATVIEAFAPRWLEADIASAIPQVAAKRKLSEAELWSRWQSYQMLLKWDETWVVPPEAADSVCDPKDLPYVLLEKAIQARGVLSNDRDIEKMGGTRLTLDFVFSVRQYARASVITVGIRVYGVMVGTVAIEVLGRLLAGIGKLMAQLPAGLKAILLMAAIVAIIHPATQAKLVQRLRSIAPALGQLLIGLSTVIQDVTEVAHEKRLEADAYLLKAQAYEA